MRELFADRWRAARGDGLIAASRCVAATIADTLHHGWAERRSVRRSNNEGIRTMWRSVRADVRFGFRRLRRRPAFTIVALVTLGLGIGAATSVFAVANAIVLRALPYANAERLLRLFERQDQEGFAGNIALGNHDDWCGIASFDACGAYVTADINLAGGDVPERVKGGGATAGLFAAFGVTPIAGRFFSADEAARNVPVAVVSQSAVNRFFGGAQAVGKTLLLDGVTHDVVGVAPDIPGMGGIAVWRALSTANQTRMNHAYRGVARLRDGASAIAAQAQLDAVSRRLQQEFPDTNAHWWGTVQPLQTYLARDTTQILQILGALVALLVLLCATNVAGLVAGQAAERRHELAVRLAVGADRRRLFTQLVVEGGVLAMGGAVAGVFLASWATAAVTAVLPPNVVLWREPGIDWAVLGFAVAIAAGAAVVFAVLPAAGVVRRALAAGDVRTAPTVAGPRGARSMLTAIQTALATVLLVAAGLLGSVLLRLVLIDPGFHPEGVLTFRVTPPRAGYTDAASLGRFYDTLYARLARLPQAERVAGAMAMPTGGPNTVRGVIRLGEPLPPPRRLRLTLFQVTTPGYFQTLGIPLRGRDFDANDLEKSPPVAIINESLASMLWPGQNAIGRQIHVHTDEPTPREVIGVAADIRQDDLEAEIGPMYYAPFTQSPRRTMTVAIKTRAPLDRATVQAELSAIDGALPLYELRPLETLIAQSTSDRKAITGIATFFGAVALLLAALGLYGLVSALVAERQREIGIRVALGAESGSILRLMLRRGLLMTSVGLAVGLGASVPASSLLQSMLTTTPPSMWITMTSVAALLVVVSLAATLIPARRALTVDPVSALRADT